MIEGMETTAEEHARWWDRLKGAYGGVNQHPELPFQSLDEAERCLRDFDRLVRMLEAGQKADAAWLKVHIGVTDERNKLREELEKCGNDRAQDQHRLFHVEGIIEDQWKAGEEAVLAFVRNGRFLHDAAPGAQFAREVEAGWKSWGKAEADKARRAEIDKAVAERATKDQA